MGFWMGGGFGAVLKPPNSLCGAILKPPPPSPKSHSGTNLKPLTPQIPQWSHFEAPSPPNSPFGAILKPPCPPSPPFFFPPPLSPNLDGAIQPTAPTAAPAPAPPLATAPLSPRRGATDPSPPRGPPTAPVGPPTARSPPTPAGRARGLELGLGSWLGPGWVLVGL